MIFGDITNISDMEKVYPAPIMKAINYLKSNDFLSMEAGVYEIEGTDIYAQVVDKTTIEKCNAKPEIHRKYIDVQFSVEGKEIIGVARETGNNKVTEDLLEENDVLFYESMENEIELVMTPGTFAIFFPNDVHRPWCAQDKTCKIRKVNVKINTEIL